MFRDSKDDNISYSICIVCVCVCVREGETALLGTNL